MRSLKSWDSSPSLLSVDSKRSVEGGRRPRKILIKARLALRRGIVGAAEKRSRSHHKDANPHRAESPDH